MEIEFNREHTDDTRNSPARRTAGGEHRGRVGDPRATVARAGRRRRRADGDVRARTDSRTARVPVGAVGRPRLRSPDVPRTQLRDDRGYPRGIVVRPGDGPLRRTGRAESGRDGRRGAASGGTGAPGGVGVARSDRFRQQFTAVPPAGGRVSRRSPARADGLRRGADVLPPPEPRRRMRPVQRDGGSDRRRPAVRHAERRDRTRDSGKTRTRPRRHRVRRSARHPRPRDRRARSRGGPPARVGDGRRRHADHVRVDAHAVADAARHGRRGAGRLNYRRPITPTRRAEPRTPTGPRRACPTGRRRPRASPGRRASCA